MCFFNDLGILELCFFIDNLHVSFVVPGTSVIFDGIFIQSNPNTGPGDL